ncbi:nucleolar complex protein 14 [Dimargaris verticillata]|uniref:Nucleolar complex protein 14 n=1 Tax=Dimargaris verticillata TaxID=2761393 RepID=A0A9W8B482_9FUNG|nr:nucleolar complex protein 14 [Dimargaris verticillata]
MDAINELDSELKEIRGLLMTGEAVDAAKSDVSASESDSDDDAQDGTDAMNVANGSDSDDADDDYNRYLRELTFERRAPATDRFKTEEELLVEEKKRLERAERHRIRRMAGEPSDTESDGESATEGQSVDPMDALSATKTTAGPQGDDLLGTTMRSTKEVDFGQLVGPGLQMQASEVVASADETGDHGDGSETTSASASAGEHSSASEESESSGSESGMEDGSDLDLPPASHGQFDQAGIYDSDNDVVPLPVPPTVSSNRPLSSVPAECTPAVDAQDDGLPFTFPAPSSYQDLAQLLKGRTVTQQATIIQRLRALYPVKLAPENKEKLRNLAQALYVHIYTITADQPTPTLATLNVFVHHLVELAPMYPDLLGELAHQQVKSFHKALLDRLRLHSGPSPMALNAAFPKVTDMVQFKLISQLMSASDFKHPVVTPLQGILAQYLAQYPAQTPRDVVCGLFICHLMLDMQRQAQRLVPEVLNYLGQVLHALYDPQLPVTNGTSQATAAHGLSSLAAEQTSSTAAPRSSQQQWGFPTPAMPIARLQQHLFMALHTTAVDWSSVAYRKLPLFALIADFRAVGLPANQFKLSVLGTAVQLLGQAADLYRENPSFPELFGPMQDYLQAFTGTTTGVTQLPAALVTVMTAVETTVRVHLNHALQSRAAFPLQLQRHRPIPLPSFVPKFEDNYSLDRHYDADRQQAELKRLKHKHTRELRGAMRELRKDAQFLAAERLRVVKERDQEYNTKIRRIMGALGDQEGDLRASDRMTKQLKRKHLKLTIRR